MAQYNIGIAEKAFTPAIGLPLMGNCRDDYAARGVHDDLFSRAMVIQDQQQGDKYALCSLDLCMIDRHGTALMRDSITTRTGIQPQNIFICATHTHSGPLTYQRDTYPPLEQTAIDTFLRDAAEAVVLANERLAPAELSIACNQEKRVSFNRRLQCKDGSTHMNWEGLDPDTVEAPLGPIDPYVNTICVEQDGVIKAALVNFALHPAILAGDNWLYSADFPGYLSEAMKKFHGHECVTFFMNGCAGNINHIDYSDPLQGRGYQMTQRVGYMLAAAVQETIRDRVPLEGNHVSAVSEKVRLQRYQITPEMQADAQRILDAAKNRPVKGQVDGRPQEQYAKIWLQMAQKQDEDDFVEVMTLCIGDLGIVGLPGEVFCELGLQLKKESPAKHTLVVELANDTIGYIPDKASFASGGYEVTPGSTHYAPDAGEKLIDTALKQLQALINCAVV